MGEIDANRIRAMLERTRRMPRLTFYRSEDLPAGQQASAPDESYSYYLYLTSLFLFADDENPSKGFLNHREIVFSAKQEVGQADLSGRLKTLSFVRTERADAELRFELEDGIQLQYGSTGDRRDVSGEVIRTIYPA